MVEAVIGQFGNAKVTMLDAAGQETDSYDQITGISYESSDPNVVSVVDDDAEPKDARLEALAVSNAPVVITCTFDGDPGDGERTITLQSEEITVVAPPPGEAVTGEFTVQFTAVPTP